MQSLIKILGITSILFLLSGCTESNLVDEVNETRNFLSGRTDAGNVDKKAENGSEDVKLQKGDKKVGEFYSWQNRAFSGEIKAPSGASLLEATVLNSVDGDTIDVQITNGPEERVRLILVNTPESKGKYKEKPQPYAIEAYEFTKNLIEGEKVWLEKGVEERDQYGRLLAYIWLENVVMNEEIETKDGELVLVGEKLGLLTLNELLLREGLAQVAIYPPNTQYVDEFEPTQKLAKKNKKGMWK